MKLGEHQRKVQQKVFLLEQNAPKGIQCLIFKLLLVLLRKCTAQLCKEVPECTFPHNYQQCLAFIQ